MSAVRTVILGAAGRDFHDFNVVFRGDPQTRVVAFTATQIPDIHGRTYPAALAGSLYPEGIPIIPEDELEELMEREGVGRVVMSYSDVSHEHVMHLASRALARGADFLLLGPARTALSAKVPVVAVCAVRTGCGKSQTTRRVLDILRESGLKSVVVRHPMPYGDLAAQRVQRFAAREDLDRAQCTVEEREEYEPHLARGAVVYAGVEYGEILARAEKEAQVILWDGGNNDLPFYRPDLHLTLVDPLRPGHETSYHPGEANLRAAHVVVINKVDTASASQVEEVRESVARLNPAARVVLAASPISIQDPALIRGKRVLVVEDGPTLTHGGMKIGAGYIAAERAEAREIVDPRPHAVGTIAEVFRRYPHIGSVLPAMGYGDKQLEDLARTISACRPEAVVIATPSDLASLVTLEVPSTRVEYELREEGRPDLRDVLGKVIAAAKGGAGRGGPAP